MWEQATHYLQKEFYQKVSTDRRVLHFLETCVLDGLGYHDLQKQEHLWMNPQFWRMLGYNPSEKQPLLSEYLTVLSRTDQHPWKGDVGGSVSSAYPYTEHTAAYCHKNGALLWLHCRTLIEKDDNGTPVRGLSVYRDITPLQQVQAAKGQAFKERKDQLQSIFDNTLDSLFTLDNQGVIINCNQSMGEMLGVSVKQLPGRNLDDFIEGESTLARYINKLNSAHKGVKRKIRTDIKVLAAAKQRLDMSLTLSRLDNADGAVLIGSLRDITERKHIERMKDSFVSTVNHELRTPLTSIQCSIDLMEKQWQLDWNPSIKKLIGIAQSNTRRIVTIVNDILDMQKIAEGHFFVESEPVALEQLIDKALTDNSSYATHHNVSFVKGDIEKEVMISGDEGRLLQVLSNFLSNAAKFSPVESQIHLYSEAKQSNNMIRVCVQDDGPGIPEQLHKKIFEPFFQVDGSRANRESSGTGLGLSISKRIIEGHHGNIGVIPSASGGSIFYFEVFID